MSKWDPRGEIHWATVTACMWQSWGLPGFPDANSQALSILLGLPPEPRHLGGPRFCFGNMSPVRIYQFAHNRPQGPPSSQTHFQDLRGLLQRIVCVAGWWCSPGPRAKGQLCRARDRCGHTCVPTCPERNQRWDSSLEQAGARKHHCLPAQNSKEWKEFKFIAWPSR